MSGWHDNTHDPYTRITSSKSEDGIFTSTDQDSSSSLPNGALLSSLDTLCAD